MDQINEHSDTDSDSDSDSIERTGDKDWNSLCCCNRKSSDDPWLHTEFICGLHCLSVHQFRLHRRYVVKDLTAYYAYEIQVNWKCYIDYICYIAFCPLAFFPPAFCPSAFCPSAFFPPQAAILPPVDCNWVYHCNYNYSSFSLKIRLLSIKDIVC